MQDISDRTNFDITFMIWRKNLEIPTVLHDNDLPGNFS